MRISDWSSDVCSSDLVNAPRSTNSATPQEASSQPSKVTAAPAATISTDHFKAMARARAWSPRLWMSASTGKAARPTDAAPTPKSKDNRRLARSEEHTSELQSLMRISYAVFCLKKKKYKNNTIPYDNEHNLVVLDNTEQHTQLP